MVFTHVPVLFHETLEALKINAQGIYIDGTFGRGGHSRGILERLGPSGKLYAIDRDLEASKAALQIDDPRFSFVRGTFGNLESIAQNLGILGKVDGLLLDIGVSSPQLDDGQRGFSFDKKGPLDMRMDQEATLSAKEVVNTYSKEELARIFKLYGEERFASKVAGAIVRRREIKPFEDTLDLAQVIEKAIPGKVGPKHKATRCFQALRIEVNHELSELESALKASSLVLNEGGVLCVITFHSLEDRIVKTFIKESSSAPQMPRGLPLTSEQLEKMRLAHASFDKGVGPIKASDSELLENPRARSATLRQAIRLKAQESL